MQDELRSSQSSSVPAKGHPEDALSDELSPNIAGEPEQSTASSMVLLSFHGRVLHRSVAIRPGGRERIDRRFLTTL